MFGMLAISSLAFLTLSDLFAAQAILPALTVAYGVSPASMAVAVNASTLGMAVGALGVALFGSRMPRRLGIAGALALLTVPTLLLATLPPLAWFALARVAQGICMSTAFGCTLGWLGDREDRDSAPVFAAYITGNVASNLLGRLVSAGLADHFGIVGNFLGFALLNLLGALLAWWSVRDTARSSTTGLGFPRTWMRHFRDTRMLAGFGIGFCILFAFIGIFSFVNFVLSRTPLSLGMMQIGYVYFVFLPAILTTPLAGAAARRFGSRLALGLGLAVALVGLPALVAMSLPMVLAGMVLVSTGTFFAQAVATGYVGGNATAERAAASGIYLASYFSGGLTGSIVLGRIFDRIGWTACVAAVGCVLVTACVLTSLLRAPTQQHALATV